MRVLFYLPAVAKNWFTDHFAPLIRAASQDAEVHVIVSPAWNGTGITDAELAGCHDLLKTVKWHVLDGEDHPSLRTVPENPAALIAKVQDIAADYTFCRSADVTTPASFPGKVVYLMEAEFAPSLPASVPVSGRVMLSGPRLYDFGFMPDLEPAMADWLATAITPIWNTLPRLGDQEADRAAYLTRMGLPLDRPIIVLPLECQTPDNAFGQVHSREAPAEDFVRSVADMGGEDWLLAVSLHPIDRQIDRTGLAERIAAIDPHRVRVVDCQDRRYRGEASERLIQHCDGLVVNNSKAISIGAYFAKPILRLSRFATADWVRAYTDPAAFRRDVDAGTAATASAADMRAWYAFHFANNAFVAAETDLRDLLVRIACPINPLGWERGMARHNLRHLPDRAA